MTEGNMTWGTVKLVADGAAVALSALAFVGVGLLCLVLGGGLLLGVILAVGVVGMLNVMGSRARAMLSDLSREAR